MSNPAASSPARRGAVVLALSVALSLALLPAPSAAIAPALLLMVREMAQQAAGSMIKDLLLSGLNGMGCKGIALSNALAGLERRGGSGSLFAGMPKMPAGGMSLEGVPPEMAAKLGAMVPGAGQLPPGLELDPAQTAMLANLQRAMAEPLSPAETVATIDELFALGFLPAAVQTEFKQCLVLVPAAVPALGAGMGMLRPMIPQLRQAREQLHALSPAEQDEVAAALVGEMKDLPADQRAALVEHLDGGFFPPRVGAAVKAGLSGR